LAVPCRAHDISDSIAPIMRRRDDLAQFLPQRRNVSDTIYFPQ